MISHPKQIRRRLEVAAKRKARKAEVLRKLNILEKMELAATEVEGAFSRAFAALKSKLGVKTQPKAMPRTRLATGSVIHATGCKYVVQENGEWRRHPVKVRGKRYVKQWKRARRDLLRRQQGTN